MLMLVVSASGKRRLTVIRKTNRSIVFIVALRRLGRMLLADGGPIPALGGYRCGCKSSGIDF